MDLTLQPMALRCAATGAQFAPDERVVSFLGRDATGALVRWDVRAAAEAQFTPPTGVICRWIHLYKPREESPERALKLGAESLFLALCDPATEPNPANAPLIQFLALMLERKKLLRPRELTDDGARRIYEHAKSKRLFAVPAGELTTEFFREVQAQLGVLVGEPPRKPPPGGASETAPAPAAAGSTTTPGSPAAPAAP